MRVQPVMRLATVALLVCACAPGTTSPATPSAPPGPSASETSTASSPPSAVASSRPSARPSSAVGAFDPIGLAVGLDGRVYVSDCDAGKIYRIETTTLVVVAGTGLPGFTGDGSAATAAQLDCPTGLAFDGSGALFVVDHANNRVRRIDRSGVISTVAGSDPTGLERGTFSGDGGPATGATLREPWGVTVDASGNL